MTSNLFKRLRTFYILFAFLIISESSCKKDRNTVNDPHHIEAVSQIDLQQISDWIGNNVPNDVLPKLELNKIQ